MYFHVYLIYRFTRTFTDHSSVITRCWGFESQNGKSSLKSPQTLATQDFAPASFLSTPDTKRPENDCFRGVLLYTEQRTGWEFPIRCAVLSCFLACVMKCPVVACAASSCLWRVGRLQLCSVCRAAKTRFLMGTDHAHCLQVGVDDDCPHELHAPAL